MRRDADFSEYVSARRAVLVRSAFLFGCGPSEAEDVVQIALIRCYRYWEKVIAAADTDAYVYRVLLNCLSDNHRRASRSGLPVGELRQHEAIEDPSDAVASRMVLFEALDALPPDRRIALVLRYFADLSERQIAEATSVPVGTVKSRLSRGLARLSADPQVAGLTKRGSMMLTDDEARTLFHAVGDDLPRHGGIADDALVRNARKEHFQRRAAQVVLAAAAVCAIVLGATSLPLFGDSPVGPSGEVAPTTAPPSPATSPTTNTASENGISCSSRIRVPTLEGLPIKRAKSVLRDACLVADIRGPGGVVKHQQPSAGAVVAPGDAVYINLLSASVDLEGVAERFLKFARGRLDGIPADAPVDMYIGGVLVKTISSEDQSQRDSWQACPDGGSYAGRVCPVSALTPLAEHRGTIAFIGSEPSHPCAHPSDPPGSLRAYQTVTLTPAEDQDCSSYFAVQLFVNDVSQVVAVNVVMSEP